MNIFKILIILIFSATSATTWAYGSSSRSTACAKPKFSEFNPANNAQVAAKSMFSFLASSGTNPDSLAVTVKGKPVAVNVTPKGQALLVTGQLPESVTQEFARINISAESVSRCKASDGWLLNVQ